MPRRTKSGKKTAVADVEDKLKRQYPGNPSAVFGTFSKTTAKGMKPARSAARPMTMKPRSSRRKR